MTEGIEGVSEINEDAEQSNPSSETGTEVTENGQFTNLDYSQVMVTSPIDPREQTIFDNEEGRIVVIHEITLGDILVSTSLVAILIFLALSRIIRR